MFRFLIPLNASGSTPQPTSWDSFEWDEDGVKLLKFIGYETEVVIPEGITEIKEETFKDCSSLTSVKIPGSVKEIKMWAFKDCPNLTICAPKGSAAEKFAKEKEIPFKAK